MVLASRSSGPIMSACLGIVALLSWRFRHLLNVIRWTAVCAYFALEALMKAPPYYLLARIDFTGSSGGWHRARLIESSIQHLSEWWLAGTDYTRHWMPTGVSWSPAHADLTNHYLHLGVLGGLPLMLTFVLILVTCFFLVGQHLGTNRADASDSSFLSWAVGSALFAHAATCISVAYFDQSILLLYLTFAACGALPYSVGASGLTESAVFRTSHRHQQRLALSSNARQLVRVRKRVIKYRARVQAIAITKAHIR